ncbi:MAG: PHP domain-containing protein, partial [Thermoproteota archaeon]
MDSNRSGGRFDLHIHTFFSKDSLIDPRVLVKTARLRGLSGFAVTDHDFFGAHRLIEAKDIIIVPGAEIRTGFGDMLALFIQEYVYSRDPLELLDKVRSQDGLLIAAHPFGFPRIRGKTSRRVLGMLDGIEVFNARNLFRSQNDRAAALAEELGKAGIGGSDAHTLREVGGAYTIADASNLEELRSRIKKGEILAGGQLSSPLIHVFSTFARLRNNIFSK